jgi:imidazolonepropionase-like amidohydrolase
MSSPPIAPLMMIDGRGKFLLPGLSDLRVHLFADGPSVPDSAGRAARAVPPRPHALLVADVAASPDRTAPKALHRRAKPSREGNPRLRRTHRRRLGHARVVSHLRLGTAPRAAGLRRRRSPALRRAAHGDGESRRTCSRTRTGAPSRSGNARTSSSSRPTRSTTSAIRRVSMRWCSAGASSTAPSWTR